MVNPIQAEIKLPSKSIYLSVALNFVREVALSSGLKANEIDFLVLATEEACSNSIEHAYDANEEGFFRLTLEISLQSITLSLCDRGLPFDYSLTPKYEPPAEGDLGKAGTRGLGLFLIEKLVDSVEWINHGMAGKELRLIKKRSGRDVAGQLPEEDPAPFPEDAPPAAEQTYTVRRMRPEDAIEISRCIYRTYGYSYEDETTYFPEQMIKLNQSGEVLSWVGVDQENNIVGYIAMKRPAGSRIVELGQAVVIPTHRGRSILALFGPTVYAAMLEMQLAGVYSRLTTVHIFSQKVSDSYGHPCAITLAYVPRVRLYKGLESHVFDERKSLVLYFCYLNPPKNTIVHAPDRHREMIERIYRTLGVSVEFVPAKPGDLPDGKVTVSYNKVAGTGTITVETVGHDSMLEIRRALYDLRDIALAEAIYLLLPMAQAGTPGLCDAAEALGFFFSGVEPSFAADGDYLRLQYLNATINYDHIQLSKPFSRDLLAYILKEKERVGIQK